MALGKYEDAIDTTADITQGAIRRNSGQPRAKKSAYLSRFCNTRQHGETGVIGLWLRRARVRVPSVTLSFAGKSSSLSSKYSCRLARRRRIYCPTFPGTPGNWDRHDTRTGKGGSGRGSCTDKGCLRVFGPADGSRHHGYVDRLRTSGSGRHKASGVSRGHAK